MKWLKRILIALALLLAVAIALPFFISLDHYIPQLEKELSATLNEPVSIRSIRFAAFPLPQVTVDGIAVGRTDDIKLERVTVTPDLLSLMTSPKVIRSIEIDSRDPVICNAVSVGFAVFSCRPRHWRAAPQPQEHLTAWARRYS
jgi:uncharacterized protein involved in outer membrane biogenesis